MHTAQEQIKLWSNDKKRKAFVHNYKAWGVWFTQPELNLIFYKYDLSDGGKLIAMEYPRTPYPHEKTEGGADAIICRKHYLQRGRYFNPNPACEYEINNHLKTLKEKLAKELKQLA